MRMCGVAAVVLAIAMAGCSKPVDVVIPSDMAKWDAELVPVLKKLSEEDRKAVAGYLARAKMGEVLGGAGVPVGTTVGDALTQQREWVAAQEQKAAEAKALKERLARERAVLAATIGQTVTVTLISKEQRPSNFQARQYSDEQVFVIGVENKGDKDLAGVAGKIHFVDIFGKQVGSVGFGIDELIKPGDVYRWTGTRKYNQFLPEHKALWNLAEGKYETRFDPQQLVFADGSKLEMPKD